MSKLICFFKENCLSFFFKFDAIVRVHYDHDEHALFIKTNTNDYFTVNLNDVFEGTYTDSDVDNLIQMIYFGNNDEQILELQYTSWE